MQPPCGWPNSFERHGTMGSMILLHEANESVHSINGAVPALSAIHLDDGDGGFLVLHKFPGLLSNFGHHGIQRFKDSSRHQTWLPSMASKCMKTLQQFSTTLVWKPFSMQWQFEFSRQSCCIGGEEEGSACLFQSQCSQMWLHAQGTS